MATGRPPSPHRADHAPHRPRVTAPAASHRPRVTAPAASHRPAPAAPSGAGDRGQASIEFLGFLPILLAIALGAVQLGLGAYAAQQAGTAARAAARTASLDDPEVSPAGAGRAAVSGWLADGTSVSVRQGGGEARATASVEIPSVIPGVSFGSAKRTATMPRREDTPAGTVRAGGGR